MRFAPGDPEVFAAGLLAAIDVDGGPTDEQRAVLRSVVHHVWQRPDLDLDALDPLTSAEVSARLSDDLDRLRFCELAMLLELCRHPQSPAQVECVEACAAALGVDGIEMATVRRALEQGAAVVAEDLERSYREILPEISELQLRDRYLTLDEPDPALGDRLRALHDLPPGTLGHAYIEFYRRNGFGLPGDDVHLPAHYVNHDMNHVITGYEPTAPGEVARSGFLVAADPSRHNWLELLLTLSIHESGVLTHGEIRAKVATLSRPGVAELLGEALERGQQCTVDLSGVDHLAIADEPLASVRARFNVVPLAHPVVPDDV
jgi:ubiquinone biosynthesis protein Coq4